MPARTAPPRELRPSAERVAPLPVRAVPRRAAACAAWMAAGGNDDDAEADNAAAEAAPAYVETTRELEEEALDPASGATIVRPTFTLAGLFLSTGGALTYLGDGFLLPGLPLVLIGLFLSVQTTRVRFVFGPTRLSVARTSGDGMKLIVGWRYDLVTNWEVWWKGVSLLAYFKEKESYGGRGSIHFFPVVCDGKQLIELLKEKTVHIDKPSY